MTNAWVWNTRMDASLECHPDLVLDKGRTYFQPKGMSCTLRHTADLVSTGFKAMVASRYHPRIIAEHPDLGQVRSIWISERVSETSIDPQNFEGLMVEMSDFLNESGDKVIVLDGIEHLSLFTNNRELQIFIEELNDIVMESRAILLIPLDPRTFDPRTLARLWRFSEIL